MSSELKGQALCADYVTSTTYGAQYNLSYTFNAVNALTQITDGDAANYLATVTCDANNNITDIVEEDGGTDPILGKNKLYSYFVYDDLNRVTNHKTKAYVASLVNKWRWTERLHFYDATGRLLKSSYTAYYAGDTPTVNSLEHTYGGSRHLQNYDNVSAYGTVWHWAGAQHEHQAPLRSPNADTASQKGYNTAVSMGNAANPQRRTWQNPTTEGDKRLLFGQGRPMAKDSSGAGVNWYVGTLSQPQSVSQGNVNSRLFFEGTVTATDMSRATDAREKGRIGIFGTAESYGGSYPRVTSEAIGRDLNPLGRGGGQALVGGMLNVGTIVPILSFAVIAGGGVGNSSNNPCSSGCAKSKMPAEDRAYGAWVAPLSSSSPCVQEQSAIWEKTTEGCCPFSCECGCQNPGSRVPCCLHINPARVKDRTPCLDSAAAPTTATVSVETASQINTFAKPRLAQRLGNFGLGYYITILGMPIGMRALRRAAALTNGLGVPSPNQYYSAGLPGRKPGDQWSGKRLPDEQGALQAVCSLMSMGNCVPRDLTDCQSKVCSSSESRVRFTYDCDLPADSTEGVAVAYTDCQNDGVVINLCIDLIEVLGSKSGVGSADAIADAIMHELYHAMLCCKTGNTKGCWSEDTLAVEVVVDSCTKKCMEKTGHGHVETAYAGQKTGAGCTCEAAHESRNCMSEFINDCAGGIQSARCQASTGTIAGPQVNP